MRCAGCGAPDRVPPHGATANQRPRRPGAIPARPGEELGARDGWGPSSGPDRLLPAIRPAARGAGHQLQLRGSKVTFSLIFETGWVAAVRLGWPAGEYGTHRSGIEAGSGLWRCESNGTADSVG